MLYMLSLLADILGFYLVSAVFVKDPSKFAFTKPFSSVALYVLIITMGLRMGANEEVTGNIGTIGLQALIITIMAIAGS
ncbi:MAG: LysO family transporter, partial [Firmicutes bacterium]|nr:LysO family transporter [Bacillota bacterium]